MRAAPVGFVPMSSDDRFRLGCDVAALTHGHPSGYLPAGYLAVVIGAIVDGAGWQAGLGAAERLLQATSGHRETSEAVRAGRVLGRQGVPLPGLLSQLGGGWTGDEALAIALACVELMPRFETGVLAAVNHSGDSDSTGSIAGNILGAIHGVEAIPERWLEALELRNVIEKLARDVVTEFYERLDPLPDDWVTRYPGW